MAKPIPDRYHTITPLLVAKNAADAIKFYKRAFDAEEQPRMPGPGGSIGHAEIKIGDSIVMLADEILELGNRGPKTIGGSPTELMLYTEDVDGDFKQSVDAGAIAQFEPADMFWGDRHGRVEDPFGHVWAVPIRLSPIPTTSRVLPIPRVKLGLGRAAISPAMSSAS